MKRKGHRRFSPHRMAENVGGWDGVLSHEIPDVVGHHAVVKGVGVGRATVIAGVGDEDLKLSGKPFPERVPVIGGAEQSVKDDERPAGRAKRLKEEVQSGTV